MRRGAGLGWSAPNGWQLCHAGRRRNMRAGCAFNERFGTEFTPGDMLIVEAMTEDMALDPRLRAG